MTEKKYVVFKRSYKLNEPFIEVHNGDLIADAIDKHRYDDVIWRRELEPEEWTLSLDQLRAKYLNMALGKMKVPDAILAKAPS